MDLLYKPVCQLIKINSQVLERIKSVILSTVELSVFLVSLRIFFNVTKY